MDSRRAFALLLRKHRRQKGITQGELGNALGVTGNAICNYETCRASPELQHLIAIANYLGFSLGELQDAMKEKSTL
jgi:transcriptional regulator with XRE-family HTH domain